MIQIIRIGSFISRSTWEFGDFVASCSGLNWPSQFSFFFYFFLFNTINFFFDKSDFVAISLIEKKNLKLYGNKAVCLVYLLS